MMLEYMKYFPILIIIITSVFYGWFWSVAIGLQSKVPDSVKMKVTKFKILFFIPMTYFIFLAVFMGSTINGLSEGGADPKVFASMFYIIVPLHLLSMFCMFYSLYFVSKTYKTVELQREVSFSDFAGEFFMIWFYPIGIWIIQPKINKLNES